MTAEGEDDAHLEENPEGVANVVRAEFLEALGAVAALEEEGFADGGLGEAILEAADLSGEDQGRVGRHRIEHRLELRRIGVLRELQSILRFPCERGPHGGGGRRRGHRGGLGRLRSVHGGDTAAGAGEGRGMGGEERLGLDDGGFGGEGSGVGQSCHCHSLSNLNQFGGNVGEERIALQQTGIAEWIL